MLWRIITTGTVLVAMLVGGAGQAGATDGSLPTTCLYERYWTEYVCGDFGWTVSKAQECVELRREYPRVVRDPAYADCRKVKRAPRLSRYIAQNRVVMARAAYRWGV